MKPVLRTESLCAEYHFWKKNYTNRNDKDLRFGQFIHINYHLVPSVGFYVEDVDQAYTEIFNELQEYQR